MAGNQQAGRVRSVALDGTVQDRSWAWPKDPWILLVSRNAFYLSNDLFYFRPWENGKCKGSNSGRCMWFGRIPFTH